MTKTLGSTLSSYDLHDLLPHGERKLSANSSAGATTISIDEDPILAANVGYIVIDPFTVEAEVRKVTNVSGTTLTVSALTFAHASGDRVLFVDGDRFSVTWWGAKGDGTTDDTDAIQASIDAVNAIGGGVIGFGGGKTYKVSFGTSVDFTPVAGTHDCALLIKANVHLRGHGATIEGPAYTSGSQSLIVNASGGTGDDGWSVSGFRIDGSSPVATEADHNAFWLGPCADWSITDCEIFDFQGDGIRMLGASGDPAQRFHVERNTLHDLGGNSMGTTRCEDFLIADNFIYSPLGSVPNPEVIIAGVSSARGVFRNNVSLDGGAFSVGGDDMVAIGNIVSTPPSNGTGLISPHGARNVIVGNTVIGTGDGTRIAGSNALKIVAAECVVSDNQIYANGFETGLTCGPAVVNSVVANNRVTAKMVIEGDRTAVTGNRIETATQVGLTLTADDCVVGHNLIRGGATTSGTVDITNALRNLLSGNFFYQTGSGPVLRETGTSDVNRYTGNSLNSGGTVTVTIIGASSRLHNNIGYVTEGSGSGSVANGGTVSHGLSTTPTRVFVTPGVAQRIACVTARAATTFTVALHDDTGAAVTGAETVYWRAEV